MGPVPRNFLVANVIYSGDIPDKQIIALCAIYTTESCGTRRWPLTECGVLLDVPVFELSLLLEQIDKRKCYSRTTVIEITVNNQRKQNKHRGIKEDLHSLFEHIGSV